jgi:hypothetical protein
MAGEEAAASLQLALGLAGTSLLLLLVAAACLLVLVLMLLLFLAGLLLGLRSWQNSRLLCSNMLPTVGLLGDKTLLLRAVGLLGSLLLSARLLAGQAIRAGLAGELHAAFRLAGQGIGVVGFELMPAACSPL